MHKQSATGEMLSCVSFVFLSDYTCRDCDIALHYVRIKSLGPSDAI